MVLLVSVATVLVAASPAAATFPGQNGKFVFANGSGAIVSQNPDGSDTFTVTNPPPGSSDSNPTWSANGQRIAFERYSSSSAQQDLYVVNADGTGLTNVTQSTTTSETEPSWSPDGTKLVFFRCCWSISTINVDGTGLAPLATPPSNTLYRRPKWAPDGTKIAFKGGPFNNEHDIYTINPNGTGLTNIANTATFIESTFDWSPDGTKIVFDGYSQTDPGSDLDVYVMNRDGTGRTDLTPNASRYDGQPVLWAPNGGQILFLSNRSPQGLYLMNTDGTSPSWFEYFINATDWQAAAVAAPAGPVRPKGATPTRVSLVPAFRRCNAPNVTHGAPLAYGSCNYGGTLSQYLTMGTPDKNFLPAKAVDSIVLRAMMGDPLTPANEADLQMTASLTDVRAIAPGWPDYIAEVRVLMTVRLTQRTELQTTTDFPFNWSVPCAATPDPSVGSTCQTTTSANALVPGAVPEGYKTMWQLGQVQVQDGGEDGEGATESDNTLYLKQGIFIP